MGPLCAFYNELQPFLLLIYKMRGYGRALTTLEILLQPIWKSVITFHQKIFYLPTVNSITFTSCSYINSSIFLNIMDYICITYSLSNHPLTTLVLVVEIDEPLCQTIYTMY